jgi:hypothetical protein
VTRPPHLSSVPVGSLGRAVSQPSLGENMILKIPYEFKIVWRYSGTADHPGCTLAARTLS